MNTTKTLLLAQALLAQSTGSLDAILGQAMGIIAKIAYLIAFCMFIYGCWRARSDLGEAVTPIGVAVLIALAAIVIDTLFGAAGLPTISIGL
ncbi:MAG TPA: hypothetical protein VIS99_12795 [Terrimicrobiaceae bacterium]